MRPDAARWPGPGCLGGTENCATLAGLDQLDGAVFPRAEQGSLSEILRVKIGAGFGVPGRCEGYLTKKLGRDGCGRR